MPTFQKDTGEVKDLAAKLIARFPENEPLKNARIDYVFAHADLDETTGEPINDALTKGGMRALGIARKLPLKDRTMGRGDAEISLDGDWWKEQDEDAQAALLDHELHHIVVTEKRDNLGRPIIKLRKHDIEFGWFSTIAARHGSISMERTQARKIVEIYGQLIFPEIATGAESKGRKLELHRTLQPA